MPQGYVVLGVRIALITQPISSTVLLDALGAPGLGRSTGTPPLEDSIYDLVLAHSNLDSGALQNAARVTSASGESIRNLSRQTKRVTRRIEQHYVAFGRGLHIGSDRAEFECLRDTLGEVVYCEI